MAKENDQERLNLSKSSDIPDISPDNTKEIAKELEGPPPLVSISSDISGASSDDTKEIVKLEGPPPLEPISSDIAELEGPPPLEPIPSAVSTKPINSRRVRPRPLSPIKPTDSLYVKSQKSQKDSPWNQFRYLLLDETAFPPTKSTPFAAGFDFYSPIDAVVPPWGKVCIDTRVALNFPITYYAQLHSRSGLVKYHDIHVAAGVIDSDYTGSVEVILYNFSDTEYNVYRSERVAQAMFLRMVTPNLQTITLQEHKEKPTREGFGSTGY